MNGWKYVSGSVALLLARQDDFTGVPEYAQTLLQGVIGTPWGDQPGNPLPEHLNGASRADIEAALSSKGWFLH